MNNQFTLEYFFFELPLYSQICVGFNIGSDFLKLFARPTALDININGYNPIRKEPTTFTLTTKLGQDAKNYSSLHTTQIKCRRFNDVFTYYWYFNHDKKEIVKVGQHPSIADFHIGEIKKYNKLLSNDKQKEFSKAIGLSAHGVGIGSFVYLRRIFEYLINEAIIKFTKDNPSKNDEIVSLRMDEKIKYLKNYLPDFLVSNRSLYSILSLGIHELSEEDCLRSFKPLRLGIELILEEKLIELDRKERIANATKELRELKSNLNNK